MKKFDRNRMSNVRASTSRKSHLYERMVKRVDNARDYMKKNSYQSASRKTIKQIIKPSSSDEIEQN